MNFQFAQKSHAFCHALKISSGTRDSEKKHGIMHGIVRKKAWHSAWHCSSLAGQGITGKSMAKCMAKTELEIVILVEKAWRYAWQKPAIPWETRQNECMALCHACYFHPDERSPSID